MSGTFTEYRAGNMATLVAVTKRAAWLARVLTSQWPVMVFAGG